MDIQMPVEDGIEASFDIRRVEQQRGWRRQRFVALTGLSNSEDVSLALEDGGPESSKAEPH
jgi:CheY-like chemotaxis protein